MACNRSLALLFVTLGLALAVGCGSDSSKTSTKSDGGADEDEEAVGPTTGSVCDPTVTYAKDIQPLMTHYCISCHAANVPAAKRYGAPLDHNFETEKGIADESVHADQDCGSGPKATNTRMPPAATLSSLNLPVPTLAERQTLSKWFACQM